MLLPCIDALRLGNSVGRDGASRPERARRGLGPGSRECPLSRRAHASNEAGIRLGDDTRGADGAVWRRADVGEYEGGFRRVPPLIAVEVAGRDERERTLREMARWYLDHGVRVVWLVLPTERAVIVIGRDGETRSAAGDGLPDQPLLPGLAPSVDDLFRRLSEGHRS